MNLILIATLVILVLVGLAAMVSAAIALAKEALKHRRMTLPDRQLNKRFETYIRSTSESPNRITGL